MKKRKILNQDILEALLSIDQGVPPFRKHGICEYVYDYICERYGIEDADAMLTESLYRRLAKEFQKWPLAREDKSYPVEGAGREFWNEAANNRLWINPRRFELLQWAIEHFKGLCDAEMD